MMYDVQVYIDEVWVKTFTNVVGLDEADACDSVQEKLEIDLWAESKDD